MKRLMLCILFLLAPAVSTAGAALRVGDKAPPFSLPDLFGRKITLDYLDGNPGVILFWSASNPGATALLEDFRGYQELWGRENLALVAVNADGSASDSNASNAVRDYAGRLELIFPVLLDRGRATVAAYEIGELPTTVVIDARGRVAAILAGAETTIRQELKQRILLALADAPLPPLP